MPTTALVERRNWPRLPLSVPAIFTATGDERRTFHGEILNLSEIGAGFTLGENIQHVAEVMVTFWLPLDSRRAEVDVLEPVVGRLTLVASRYAESFGTYAYGGLFVGLTPTARRKIRSHLRRSAVGAEPLG